MTPGDRLRFNLFGIDEEQNGDENLHQHIFITDGEFLPIEGEDSQMSSSVSGGISGQGAFTLDDLAVLRAQRGGGVIGLPGTDELAAEEMIIRQSIEESRNAGVNEQGRSNNASNNNVTEVNNNNGQRNDGNGGRSTQETKLTAEQQRAIRAQARELERIRHLILSRRRRDNGLENTMDENAKNYLQKMTLDNLYARYKDQMNSSKLRNKIIAEALAYVSDKDCIVEKYTIDKQGKEKALEPVNLGTQAYEGILYYRSAQPGVHDYVPEYNGERVLCLWWCAARDETITISTTENRKNAYLRGLEESYRSHHRENDEGMDDCRMDLRPGCFIGFKNKMAECFSKMLNAEHPDNVYTPNLSDYYRSIIQIAMKSVLLKKSLFDRDTLRKIWKETDASLNNEEARLIEAFKTSVKQRTYDLLYCRNISEETVSKTEWQNIEKWIHDLITCGLPYEPFPEEIELQKHEKEEDKQFAKLKGQPHRPENKVKAQTKQREEKKKAEEKGAAERTAAERAGAAALERVAAVTEPTHGYTRPIRVAEASRNIQLNTQIEPGTRQSQDESKLEAENKREQEPQGQAQARQQEQQQTAQPQSGQLSTSAGAQSGRQTIFNMLRTNNENARGSEFPRANSVMMQRLLQRAQAAVNNQPQCTQRLTSNAENNSDQRRNELAWQGIWATFSYRFLDLYNTYNQTYQPFAPNTVTLAFDNIRNHIMHFPNEFRPRTQPSTAESCSEFSIRDLPNLQRRASAERSNAAQQTTQTEQNVPRARTEEESKRALENIGRELVLWSPPAERRETFGRRGMEEMLREYNLLIHRNTSNCNCLNCQSLRARQASDQERDHAGEESSETNIRGENRDDRSRRDSREGKNNGRRN